MSYRIGRPPLSVPLSSVGRPHSLNIFSSETTGPIEARFHMESPWDAGMKVLFLVTWPRRPPCPYMVKTLKNLLLRNQKGRWPWTLVGSIECSSTTKFVQMMTLGWPWPVLRQGQIWSPYAFFIWEKDKNIDVSETIVVYDLKTQKVAGYYIIPSENFECLSVQANI